MMHEVYGFGEFMVRLLASIFLASAFAGAHSINLVRNGDFEAGSPHWTQSTRKSDAIGDWSSVFMGSSRPGGVPMYGPPTNTVWLGGYNDGFDWISQTVDMSGVDSAVLAFDLYIVSADLPGYDHLDVFFDGSLIDEIDLGDPDEFGVLEFSMMYDLTGLLSGTDQILEFVVPTDGMLPSSVFIDNVQIEATMAPEPATLFALVGGLAFLRRRKKA